MTWRVVFSSPGEWWSSPLPPSGRPGTPQTQHFCETEGYSSTFPAPQRPGGHHRTPCNRPTGLARPAHLSPGPAPWTPAPIPRGEPGSPCRQEPPAELGAAGAQGVRGAPGAVTNVPFRARLPRGAFQWLCSEPLISAPAPAYILTFLGGDFSQSGLYWCLFMLWLMAGNLSMLWYVFRFRVVLGGKD